MTSASSFWFVNEGWRKSVLWLSVVACFLIGGGFVIALAKTTPEEVRLSSYATSLEGRVKGQRANAELSLDKLDGVVVKPGQVFSFNKTVGTWSRDEGYRKAPVSFNGQLVWTWGGGVCQTSSTLYNAALLSGMEIVERHRHRFAPGYIPPGRDAAVAYSNVDLAFRNPYPWPVRLRARVENGRVVCETWGKERPEETVTIKQELRGIREPMVLSQRSAGPSGTVMNPGKPGFSVATFRVFRDARGSRTELLSQDEYPAMNRVIRNGR